MEWQFVQVILYPMNTADSIVTVMNISQNIDCFHPIFCNIWNSFLSSFSHLIIYPMHVWSYSTDNSNSASSFPMTNCWGHASSWESTSGRPDLSRDVSLFLTDCAIQSRRITSWEKPGRTFRIILQEVLSGRPDRSYVLISVVHSWEERARSSYPTLRSLLAEETLSHELLMKIGVGSFFIRVEDDTCDGTLQ